MDAHNFIVLSFQKYKNNKANGRTKLAVIMDFFVVLIIEQKQRQFMTRLTALNAENFKMDGGACFGIVPKTIWGKNVPSDSENLIEMSSRCLLAEKNDK